MADNIIDFDGFEKYGPIAGVTATWAAPQYNLVSNSTPTVLFSQSAGLEWLSQQTGGGEYSGLIQGIRGTGIALLINNGGGSMVGWTRTMPANYSRIIFGFAFKSNLVNTCGITFYDGATVQCSVWIDTVGRINVSRSDVGGGNSLYQSAALVLNGVAHYLEIDITFHNSAGAFHVWLDGVSLTSLGTQNTRAGSNNYTNQFAIRVNTSSYFAVDDMYWRDNSGGTATPFGDCTIDGLKPTSDSVVQFTPTLSALGPYYMEQSTASSAPGANVIALTPVTPEVNQTLNTINVFPAATNGTVKFKGVVYSDSSGNPGSLLSSGTEAIGCTSGVVLPLALVTPQALTGGTQYWIGYITDTSVVVNQSDPYKTPAQTKANTYGSGAPAGPLSGMSTNQASWMIWGGSSGAASNYAQVDGNPPPVVAGSCYSYNSDATVGHEDLLNISDLTVTPTAIYSVKVSVLAQRSDSGARTMDIRLKSGSTDDAGSNAGITPATSMQWYSSRWDTDPAGGAWNASGVNGILAGYKVAS